MSRARINTALATAALVLAGLAVVAGARPDPSAHAIDAVTLAEWIRDRRNLVVLDLRDTLAYEQFSVPTSRPVPAEGLTVPEGDTLVLVDGGDGRAAAAALRLRPAPAYWLRGGAEAWATDLLNATIAEDASDSAFAAFARTAALSRYFGGSPRVVPPGTRAEGIEATVRRGCGF